MDHQFLYFKFQAREKQIRTAHFVVGLGVDAHSGILAASYGCWRRDECVRDIEQEPSYDCRIYTAGTYRGSLL